MIVEKILPVLVLATIAFGSLLLGMGNGDFQALSVAIAGSASAYILVDRLQWFYLPQWLVSILAIAVTAFTVSNFYFINDTVRHLLGVGKLLIYLQTLLLFQQKSSRVYWQVMVLTLLQVVVGAVFNLGFEGGVLFIIYMMVAGVTMMMLHLYQIRQTNRNRNLDYLQLSQGKRIDQSRVQVVAISNDQVMSGPLLRKMVSGFAVFGIGSLLFAISLFYFLPRDSSSWAGPEESSMAATGFDKKVDLNHPDQILLSTKLEMNARYWFPGKKEVFNFRGQPYIRGVALHNVQTEGNRTRWIPPPNQVYDSDFRPLRNVLREPDRHVVQEIILEPTEDPLLYSAFPPKVGPEQELGVGFNFCWPLGGLTRERSPEKMVNSTFRYELRIPILDNGEFHVAHNYFSRPGYADLPLTREKDPGNFRWLTYLERERYPTIVSVGQQILNRFSEEDHYEIAKQMEAYFLGPEFRYTLDYRGLQRNSQIDCVEDFVANFKAGHCEYFASALALMLRSQGIPARLVVGFRGGSVNEFGGHLDVESRHAHAWVEAYIRPKDCPENFFTTGQATRRRGCWLRLDPTPSVDLDQYTSSGDDALDFAKSLWRDYVLGLQSESQSRALSATGFGLSGLLRLLDLEFWQNSITNLFQDVGRSGGWRSLLVPVGILLVVAWGIWFLYRRKNTNRYDAWSVGSAAPDDNPSATHKQVTWVQRKMGQLLGIVAPKLGRWIQGESGSDIVPFNARLMKTLQKAGFERRSDQTQMEFASSVSRKLAMDSAEIDVAEKETSSEISEALRLVTNQYYRVRFGGRPLDVEESSQIDLALARLEDGLARRPGMSRIDV